MSYIEEEMEEIDGYLFPTPPSKRKKQPRKNKLGLLITLGILSILAFVTLQYWLILLFIGVGVLWVITQ